MKNGYQYYQVTMEGQTPKLIKTNRESCEIITYRHDKPFIRAYPGPYPDYSGEEIKPLDARTFEEEKKKSIPFNH